MGDAAYVPLDALTRMVRPDLRPLQGVAERGALGSDAALERAPPHEGVSLSWPAVQGRGVLSATLAGFSVAANF